MTDPRSLAAVQAAMEHLDQASRLITGTGDRTLAEQALRPLAEVTGLLAARVYRLKAEAGGTDWPPEPETYW
jgi:hypothetical protein